MKKYRYLDEEDFDGMSNKDSAEIANLMIARAEKQIETLTYELAETRAKAHELQKKVAELEEANANCISLTLHESRMQNMEKRLRDMTWNYEGALSDCDHYREEIKELNEMIVTMFGPVNDGEG